VPGHPRLLLPSEIVSCDSAPPDTLTGLKDLFKVTGAPLVDRVSVAVAAVALRTPWSVVRLPAASVLVAAPVPAGACTSTAKVQDVPPTPRLAPDRDTVVLPGLAVSVPPHVLVSFAGLATVWPAMAPMLSVRAIPVKAAAPLAWVMTTVSREMPDAPMVAGVNDLASVAPAETVSTADVVLTLFSDRSHQIAGRNAVGPARRSRVGRHTQRAPGSDSCQGR
jgi:hypothetical protein